jgi:hypothetical protein
MQSAHREELAPSPHHKVTSYRERPVTAEMVAAMERQIVNAIETLRQVDGGDT